MKMDKAKIVPSILITLDLLASIGYGYFDHDWRKVIYWFAAAVLTAMVTF